MLNSVYMYLSLHRLNSINSTSNILNFLYHCFLTCHPEHTLYFLVIDFDTFDIRLRVCYSADIGNIFEGTALHFTVISIKEGHFNSKMGRCVQKCLNF